MQDAYHYEYHTCRGGSRGGRAEKAEKAEKAATGKKRARGREEVYEKKIFIVKEAY